jgi:hypothetical protein
LLGQLSIVLIYQPQFYQQLLGVLAESLTNSQCELVKSVCSQLVTQLHALDAKLLDSGIGKLDFSKKS